ncbi:FG-GAP repeat protein [Bythopirellula goksoeyrii]|uniref:PEP-CTERM protein-sorting domain-containing protein n=1 Tax=Bythopirellula goksoeyrii TaxID=1400387 RepID=A0A5B9QKH5_9BACT|nr:FG-GAP repeat protein [Bythopirellula goksoeyrii]QEG34593.1 hypothetical protein Pr1d_18740 [Bythopirellula goksoeyrii]
MRRLIICWFALLLVGVEPCVFSPKCLASQLSFPMEKILPPSPVGSGLFGGEVALQGQQLIVSEKRLGIYGGSADVFHLSPAGANFQATLIAPSFTADFGIGVAISYGNTSTPSRAIVAGRDAAYVFTEGSSGWENQPTGQLSWGGGLVAIDGNVAVGHGAPGTGTMVVHEFTETLANQWKPIATLVGGNEGFGGGAVLQNGTAVIASPTEDAGSTNSGAVYAYQAISDTWQATDRLVPSDPLFRGGFGTDIDLEGDTLMVSRVLGGPSKDGPQPGVVSVYERSGTDWIETLRLTSSDSFAGDGFGSRVAVSRNFAAVLATGHAEGRVYVFRRQSAGWNELGWVSTGQPFSSLYDQFGVSLDLDGSTLVVGARLDDEAGDQAGAVYRFTIPEPSSMALSVLGISLLASRSLRKIGKAKNPRIRIEQF